MAEPGASPIRAVFDRAAELEAAGRDIVHLEIGRPHLTSPDVATRAAVAALEAGDVHYTESRGRLELREAIAAELAGRGVARDPGTEIVVTAGGSEAVAATCLSVLRRGDEAIVPLPAWPHYAGDVMLAGGTAVTVPSSVADGFQPDVDAIAAAITSHTRLLIVSSPSNPTGATFAADRLEALARLVRDHDLLVLSDEIYAPFVYDGAQHVSIAAMEGMAERTVVVDSCSKAFAMTGWRVGFAAAPAELAGRITAVHQHLGVCAPSFAQQGATAAYRHGAAFTSGMVAEYSTRREELVAGLADVAGLDLALPDGAIYAFPRVTAPGHDGTSLARLLIEEAGVACVPGAPFGVAEHLRMSYAVAPEVLAEGISRVRLALASA